jgi:hypothetical protein
VIKDQVRTSQGDIRRDVSCSFAIHASRCGRIEKDGAPLWPALSLERKSDQVPEGSLRNEVLGREQAVVTRQIELGSELHCLAEDVHPQASSRRSRDRSGKECPLIDIYARSVSAGLVTQLPECGSH